MNITDIVFSFDLGKRRFSRIELKLNMDIDPDSAMEEKKRRVLDDFKIIETYFDSLFRNYKEIKKEVTGTEYTTFISAGFIYSGDTLSRDIWCQLQYNFGIREGGLKIPTIDITLEASRNFNYWILEDLINSINFSISNDALKILKRMRSKLRETREDQDPALILSEFSYKKSEISEKSEIQAGSREMPVSPEHTGITKEFMAGQLDVIAKKIKKKNKFYDVKRLYLKLVIMFVILTGVVVMQLILKR